MRVSVGRHSAGGDLPACPRAGSEGGEIRCASFRAIRHRRELSFIDAGPRMRGKVRMNGKIKL